MELDDAALMVRCGGASGTELVGVPGRTSELEPMSSEWAGGIGGSPFAAGNKEPLRLATGAASAGLFPDGSSARRAAVLSGFDHALTAGSGAGSTSRGPGFVPPFCLLLTVCQPSCWA